jgi:hypothetical protein
MSHRGPITQGPKWNYTSVFNIAFPVVAASLIGRSLGN